MRAGETRELLAKLLWFRDEIDSGRCDAALVRDYNELSARVEVATLNMEAAETEVEAQAYWERAAAEIRDFLEGQVQPSLH